MDTAALVEELERLRERVRELEGEFPAPKSALERLAAGAPMGLAIVDSDLRYLFINEYLAGLHGRKPVDCLGRTLREATGVSAERLEPVCRLVLQTGQAARMPVALPSGPQSGLPVGSTGEHIASCYALRDADGAVAGVCCSVGDGTPFRSGAAGGRDSEHSYRDLAQSLSEFVWSEDAGRALDYSNPHAIEYTGTATAADWRGAFHPEDAERLDAELAGAPGQLQIEMRIRRAADGEYRWHLVRIARLPGDERGRARLLGTAIDIHDRKREEQTRALLASIVESSSDSIIGLDLEGRITSWNPAAEKLFGYAAADAIGRSASILTPLQTEDALRDTIARVGRGETMESNQTIRATADGRELQVFVSFAPIRDEAGRVTGAFKTVRDVTEQRRAERELRAAHERVRMAQQALKAGVWEMDPETGAAQWSPEIYELAGIDLSQPPSFDLWLSRVHPDDAARVRRNIMRTRERHDDLRHQFRLIRNGQLRWITTFGQVVRDPGGRPRLIGITLDTTDLHAAEEAVRQAARFESISRLAGGVAHDFNNLLAGIMGGASFISEVLPDDHSARSMLDLIVRSSERAATLTRQLLAYSGQGAFAPRRLDFALAVQEACSLMRGSLAPRVEIEVQSGWNLPKIEADPNQIREVVLGLIANASEAIGESSGAIFVRTGVERLDRAAIASRFSGGDVAPGPYLYLEVQDTGSGITPEIANRIFEPFFTTKFMGRGLGLSAIQGIVRGHHGAIEVDTKPGAGARFRVYFPPAEAGQQAEPAPGHARGAVLVIDDEEAVRDVVRAALSRAGYTVMTASDGLSGLETLRSNEAQISLVILDVSMPKMSGGQVLGEMRRAGARPKVLITSGYPESEAMSRIPQQDIAGFLQKPFTVRQLTALIARVTEEGVAAGSD